MAEFEVGEAKRKPNFGFAKGTISMSPDFDEIPDEFLSSSRPAEIVGVLRDQIHYSDDYGQADAEIVETFDESV